jgi:hypothetical protein
VEKSLRKLIREMIVSEAYEHTDDEMVTFANIDLQHEFDKLNNMLFNGELTTIPIDWSKTRGKYGHVRYQYNRATRMPTRINGLFITKFFKITYRKFKDILAHEMIHVKNIQDSMRNRTPRYKRDAHGYEFIKELNRINSMGLGFNVTDKEYDSHEVSDDIKGKEMYIGVLRLSGVKSGTFIIAMTPAAYNQRHRIIDIFNHVIKTGKYKSVEIEYFRVDSPYFLKFRQQRNFNTNVGYAPAKQEDLDKLDEVGEEVDFVSIGDDGSNRKEEPSIFKKPEPTMASRPESRPEPSIFKKPDPIKPEPVKIDPVKPVVPDEIKEVNRKVMAIFKSTTDKIAQEKLFDILKTTDVIKKQIKIDNYNQNLGPKYGFID